MIGSAVAGVSHRGEGDERKTGGQWGQALPVRSSAFSLAIGGMPGRAGPRRRGRKPRRAGETICPCPFAPSVRERGASADGPCEGACCKPSASCVAGAGIVAGPCRWGSLRSVPLPLHGLLQAPRREFRECAPSRPSRRGNSRDTRPAIGSRQCRVCEVRARPIRKGRGRHQSPQQVCQ